MACTMYVRAGSTFFSFKQAVHTSSLILFMHAKHTKKLHDSGNPPFGVKRLNIL